MPDRYENSKTCGVLPATVSRVLNHDETISVSKETRKRIFETAELLSLIKNLLVLKKMTNPLILWVWSIGSTSYKSLMTLTLFLFVWELKNFVTPMLFN